MAMAADQQVYTGQVRTEGGGAPTFVNQFQILLDTTSVTLVLIQRSVEFVADKPTPQIRHIVVAQAGMAHMLAKDLHKKLGEALVDFEKQYPIPVIQPPPPPKNA
jgi:hypothetical protein